MDLAPSPEPDLCRTSPTRPVNQKRPAWATPSKLRLWGACGDDLVEIGANFINPFQPEVMDVVEELRQHRGKLAFHGGLSIQRTLPFGSAADVREQTQRLLEAGGEGGYIFAPAHDVPRDVPPENIIAMLEVLRSQPGLSRNST